ncbi:MAG: serine/threonine protein kinase [Polyangiaceae bacterium]|nr:serine/threonine protein kinase [Polyangiaceae bacterium]MCB9610353.1 serine/threonine protein kinase [Polyangiaceae bacterium]
MTAVDEQLPRRFGRFVLFDKIGEGGMARIYLAKSSTGLGGERRVVVKQILPLLSDSSEFSRLFIDEAKLSAKLTHGSIAQVIDLGREEGSLYIAMEYVEGFDLRELLRACSKKQIPLPVEFALLIISETLKALDYAHRKRDENGKKLGIVHRDVSPSNVLISFEGEIKLCDFGIARAMGSGEDVPEEAIQGKAGYMSPEAANGEALDGRADVFAAGIMLWELLAGRRLYRSPKGSPGPSLVQAQEALIPELPSRGYPNEERLHGIAMKLLSKDREARYGSAHDALRELEDYVAENSLVASPLRFGEWLMEHFGAEILERRQHNEQAANEVLDQDLEGTLGKRPKPEPLKPSEAPQASSLSAGNADVKIPAAFSDRQPKSEPVSSPVFEPPPPSLQAVVRPSEPAPETASKAWMLIALAVVVIVGVAAYFMTRPGPTP